VDDLGYDVVCLAGLLFGEADLGISGSMKLPAGLRWSASGIVRPRTALVAATKPSWIASGTSIRRPVTSPGAKTWGAEVRR